MTDRIHSFLVVLEDDIREDDAQVLIQMFMQLKGVVAVTAQVSDPASLMAEMRAKHELSMKILAVLQP